MTAADACPGILDMHAARDGHVARIRLPGGYATATRLSTLAAIAARFGDGHVDLTARGNVQLRGVRPAQAAELAERAMAAGLLPSPVHDRARNITAGPLAGLAGHPDLRGLVRSLDLAIRAEPGLAALPGRFLFSLDDGTGRAGLGGCDAGLRRDSGGVSLIVAGRETGLRGPARQGVSWAIAAACGFLAQRAPASATRIGPATPIVLPTPGTTTPAGPATSRMAGLPDGGAGVVAMLGGRLGEQVFDITARLPLGHIAGIESVAVVAAPLARLTAPQLRLIAGLLRPGEAARLTSAGRIVLPLRRAAGQTMPELAAAGLLISDDHPLSAVTACSGAACASSLADVRALARRVTGHTAVHWAGCARRCGRPADATAVVAIAQDQFEIADGSGRRLLSSLAEPG